METGLTVAETESGQTYSQATSIAIVLQFTSLMPIYLVCDRSVNHSGECSFYRMQNYLCKVLYLESKYDSISNMCV